MISKNIKQIRNEKRLTLRELSELSGVSKSTISDIENNKVNPSTNTLEKLAKGLSVNVEDFFKVTDEKLKEWDNKYNKNGKLAKEVKSIENAERIAPTLDSIPTEFTSPQEARAYINMHQIFGSDGLDPDDLDDDEILEFANELLKQMKLISYKYKR